MSERSDRDRKRYAEDPPYRRRRLAWNAAWRKAHGNEINARRRLRWATDPDYRERQLAPRRGSCQRNYDLARLYGITLADYERLFARQKGRCAICRKTSPRTLHVDHCHRTRALRCLLCSRCNLGLGHFGDDVRLVRRAAAYLDGPRQRRRRKTGGKPNRKKA